MEHKPMKMLEKYTDQIFVPGVDSERPQPIDIAAAAHLYLKRHVKSQHHTEQMFVPATPLFPLMWMEFTDPAQRDRQRAGSARQLEIDQVGCLAHTFEVEEDDRKTIIERDFVAECAVAWSSRFGSVLRVDKRARARQNKAVLAAGRAAHWVTIWSLYASSHSEGCGEMESIVACIDGAGRPIAETRMLAGSNKLLKALAAANIGVEHLHPFLFATALLHTGKATLEPLADPVVEERRGGAAGKQMPPFQVLRLITGDESSQTGSIGHRGPSQGWGW